MKVDYDEVTALVLDTVQALGDEIENPSLQSATPQTRLLGDESALDSINLVTLIADLEERIAERYEHDLVLADERAMSRIHSPFRCIATLARYIEGLLEKAVPKKSN